MDTHALAKRCREAAKKRGFSEEILLETQCGPVLGFKRIKAGAPVVYLSSGIHGDEPSGPNAICELLENDQLDSEKSWLVCPMMNPTGLAAGTRETAKGKDINRDYKKCETAEAAAHVEWLREQPVPELFFSLHEDWESTGIYLYEINCLHGRTISAQMLKAAEPYFQIEPEEVIDDHPVRSPGWIYHLNKPDMPDGWPEAIFAAHIGCPVSYTVETPSSFDLRRRIDCHKAMVLEGLAAFEFKEAGPGH